MVTKPVANLKGKFVAFVALLPLNGLTPFGIFNTLVFNSLKLITIIKASA